METAADVQPKKTSTVKTGKAGKSASKGNYKRATQSLSDDTKIESRQEQVVDPISIIQGAKSKMLHSDELSDAEFNPIEAGDISEKKKSTIIKDDNNFFEGVSAPMNIDKPEVPKIRKVAIKKINRFNFRLGMEKTPEKYNLLPGTAHTWVPYKKGNEFFTGLEDKPEDKARLEKALRLYLSNTSEFWASLTFRLEDKEHGTILNFDDRAMGNFYEVVYNAMTVDPIIANGYHEYKSGKKPLAEWYIENKEAEAEAKQADMTAENEAFEMFNALSQEKRADIGKLMVLPVWGLTPKAASVEVWDHIKKNTENAKKFLELARLNQTTFNVTILVTNAIRLNVIRRNKINDLVFANEPLGPSIDHVVSRLSSAPNSELRMAIQRQVEAKLRS